MTVTTPKRLKPARSIHISASKNQAQRTEAHSKSPRDKVYTTFSLWRLALWNHQIGVLFVVWLAKQKHTGLIDHPVEDSLPRRQVLYTTNDPDVDRDSQAHKPEPRHNGSVGALPVAHLWYPNNIFPFDGSSERNAADSTGAIIDSDTKSRRLQGVEATLPRVPSPMPKRATGG